jgi:hypothetical protein
MHESAPRINMKKLFAIFGILFLCSLPFLYGQTITLPGMTEVTSIAANDLLWVWLDPAGGNVSRKIKASNLLRRLHSCEIVIGNPNTAGAVLADGDDAPAVCGNVSGSDQTITAVACQADATGASVLPTLTGGGTILSGAITCGNGTWAAGTISGTPTLKTFSANGATCAVTPCTLDATIAAAGGNARYAIIRFTISGM